MKADGIYDAFSRLCKTLATVAGFLILLITFLTTFEVIVRFVLHSPTSWTLEVSEQLLVPTVFLAIAFVHVVGENVKIDFVLNRFARRPKSAAILFADVVIMVFCALLVWKSGQMFLESWRLGRLTGGMLQIPLAPAQGLIVMGSFLLFLAGVGKLCEHVKGVRTKVE